MIAGTKPKKTKALVTATQLEELLRRQQFKCGLTGVELTPALSSLDHIDPRSIGGNDDIANLQIVLPCVNKAKGTMRHDQFVAMCHAVARQTDDTGDETWISYTGHPTGG
jgi:5-methylcytosine-specific restriction endonuclease McrA